MIGRECLFDCVQLLYYKCRKINPNLGGSYIDSPAWIKNEKATITPINKKDNKWLNYEKIGKHVERITKMRLFINKYKWERIKFTSEKHDWKTFEKNNVTISLNVLYAKKNLFC